MHIGKNIFQKIATIKTEISKHETEDDIESTREVSSAKQTNTNISDAKTNNRKIAKNKNHESEDDIDPTKEIISNSSKNKVHIGKIISQNFTKSETEISEHETEEETESTREVINKEQEKFFNCEETFPSVETFPKINLLTDNAKENNSKISEKQKYSSQIQETEGNFDSTKEVNSDISQTKVHIGKNIFQKIAKI